MSQYLGDISAYALAVSQGYTGTEEEYAELMASYATVGQTAVTAAQTATTKASEAATSATTATNKATEATTAATTATTKAGEASTSASTATSAKDTAVSASQTATSKASEATTAAATAVSAKDDAVSANTAAQSAKTAAQTAQTGAETAAASVQSSAAQIQTNADDISELKEDFTTTASKEDMLKSFPTDTASGSVASFADGANVPVKSLIVNIAPVQSGSGDPSPDNVRPISGWSEVNVHRMSKNRLPFPYYAKSQTNNGVTFTVNDDGSIKIKGTATATSNFELAQTGTENVVENGEYIVSLDGGINNVLRFLFGANNSGIAYDGAYGTDAKSSKRITVSNSGILGYCLIQVSSGATIDTTVYPMIRLASDSDPTYVPYNSVSLNIPLGQTVYGGTLDVTTGVMTVNKMYYAFTGNESISVGQHHGVNRFDATVLPYTFVGATTDMLCSHFLPSNTITSSTPNLDNVINAHNKRLLLRDDACATVADMKEYFTQQANNGTPVQAVVPMEPITVQLTPHEVTALLGSNNVWADSGNSEVEYRADTKLYIQKKIAEAISALS